MLSSPNRLTGPLLYISALKHTQNSRAGRSCSDRAKRLWIGGTWSSISNAYHSSYISVPSATSLSISQYFRNKSIFLITCQRAGLLTSQYVFASHSYACSPFITIWAKLQNKLHLQTFACTSPTLRPITAHNPFCSCFLGWLHVDSEKGNIRNLL